MGIPTYTHVLLLLSTKPSTWVIVACHIYNVYWVFVTNRTGCVWVPHEDYDSVLYQMSMLSLWEKKYSHCQETHCDYVHVVNNNIMYK